jgi:hypothetical protein
MDGPEDFRKTLYKDETRAAMTCNRPINPLIVYASLWEARQGMGK